MHNGTTPPKMDHQSCCQTWTYLKSPLLIGQTLAFQVTARISLPLVEGTTAKKKETETGGGVCVCVGGGGGGSVCLVIVKLKDGGLEYVDGC
jgi:hypothetical protein